MVIILITEDYQTTEMLFIYYGKSIYNHGFYVYCNIIILIMTI